jgi:hypothetical protein
MTYILQTFHFHYEIIKIKTLKAKNKKSFSYLYTKLAKTDLGELNALDPSRSLLNLYKMTSRQHHHLHKTEQQEQSKKKKKKNRASEREREIKDGEDRTHNSTHKWHKHAHSINRDRPSHPLPPWLP